MSTKAIPKILEEKANKLKNQIELKKKLRYTIVKFYRVDLSR